MDILKYRYISICGGGMFGRFFLAIKQCLDAYLVETTGSADKWWNAIEGVSGCSVGAWTALVLLLRLPDDIISNLMGRALKRSTYMNPDIGTLVEHFGLDNAHGLYDIVTASLEAAGLSHSITFQELRRYLRKDLVIVATNVEHAEKLYLSADTFPNMEVREAVVASCRLPFIYPPKRIAPGITLVDGGLCENEPVYFPVEDTLNWGFVRGRNSYCIETPLEYATALFGTASAHQRNAFHPEHTLYAFCPSWVSRVPCFTFDEPDEDIANEMFRLVEFFVSDQLRDKKKIRVLFSIVLIMISLSLKNAPNCESSPSGSQT